MQTYQQCNSKTWQCLERWQNRLAGRTQQTRHRKVGPRGTRFLSGTWIANKGNGNNQYLTVIHGQNWQSKKYMILKPKKCSGQRRKHYHPAQGPPTWGTFKGNIYLFPNILTLKFLWKPVDFYVSHSFFEIRNLSGTCSSVEIMK